jgi:hypothetical protein
MERFEQRRATAHGTFITRAEIEEKNPLRISDLFYMVPNTILAPDGRGGMMLQSMRGGGLFDQPCTVPVFVDGVRTAGGIDAMLSPELVEAVEVYTGLADTPPQFGPSRCGAVAIWLRGAVGPDEVPERSFGKIWKGLLTLAGIAALAIVVVN